MGTKEHKRHRIIGYDGFVAVILAAHERYTSIMFFRGLVDINIRYRFDVEEAFNEHVLIVDNYG